MENKTLKLELTEDEWVFVMNAIGMYERLNASCEDMLGNEIWTEDERDALDSLRKKGLEEPGF